MKRRRKAVSDYDEDFDDLDSDESTPVVRIGDNHSAQLRSFVERYERLDAEAKEISDLKRDLMTEAKSAGFDPKILRMAIREKAKREKDKDKYDHEQAVLGVYLRALGLGPD